MCSFCSILAQLRSLTWECDNELWTSTLSSIHITLAIFVNVSNMHETPSLLIIWIALYWTWPLNWYTGQWYQSAVIIGVTSLSLIDDCITVIMFDNIIIGFNSNNLVLSPLKTAFVLKLQMISPDINIHTNWLWPHFACFLCLLSQFDLMQLCKVFGATVHLYIQSIMGPWFTWIGISMHDTSTVVLMCFWISRPYNETNCKCALESWCFKMRLSVIMLWNLDIVYIINRWEMHVNTIFSSLNFKFYIICTRFTI